MPKRASASGGKYLMQVATNAKRHGVQQKARHSISASAFPIFTPTFSAFSSFINIDVNPLAICVGADSTDCGRTPHGVVNLNLQGEAALLPRDRSLCLSAVMDGKT
jgi:hypothetical protein